MTRTEDIERVLDRFYAEGPSEMPDRLFLSVIDQIERVPQRRLANQMTRFATMNARFRLAAAAAIVVAVVGVGAYALTRLSSVASQPTPRSSQVASPTPGAGGSAPLPAALQGRWVGAPRVVPEAPEPPYRNALLLTDVQAGFALVGQNSQQEFASIAALAAPDQVRLRGASTDGGCKPRDEGTYTFKLDASGTALTLTPIADACGPRATALTGEWVHVGCTQNQGWCLGDLPAGTHVSTIFTPFVAPSAWTYAYGKFTYTTPAGWASTTDCDGCYVLAKQGAPANTNINIWNDVAAHRQDDQCTGGPAAGVGRSADAIVTWLTTLPGLVTSTPVPVTIGGLSGKMVDLAVKPTWTATCSYADPPGRALVSTFSDPVKQDGLDWNIQADGQTRIIALDLGDGRALVIDIEGQTKADYDALLPDAMQVVNTFSFSH
ncbi:MAG: hypothetical protein QOI92_689 [Chloroflexota bacterium]|jgi:hypothetical protein|nr:hypothetical protein [Chloroflexota bacterium]